MSTCDQILVSYAAAAAAVFAARNRTDIVGQQGYPDGTRLSAALGKGAR